jgi:hypothetical protein
VTDLAHIEITSGLTLRDGGTGLCFVTAVDGDGNEIRGQLPPDEVRRMALAWLECADAAVSDAAVFRLLTDRLELDPGRSAAFVADLRNFRSDMVGQ